MSSSFFSLSNSTLKRLALAVSALALASSCIHKKYETPITKQTQQPDKILFDTAMHDIERGRYEVARISLQTLMTTYESSEYLAKAKLAIADSWFREGGSNGMAQAEAEYKDFQLFYPNMEESAQAQNRVCDIHYKQMDKSDRDIVQTLRAEAECKNLINQYPNSKFVPEATQKLRDIQESLAEHEFKVGDFYWSRGMNPAAANRLSALVGQYPLYSKAGDALFEAGDSYSKMGPRFRKDAGEMFSRIVSDYPLSDRAKAAAKRLQDLELPVPAVNQAALERAKWEQENYQKLSMMKKGMGILRGAPDVSRAAHSGAPTMTDPKKTIPVSVPVVNPTTPTDSTETSSVTPTKTEVTATPAAETSNEAKKDAASGTPLPTNRDKELAAMRAKQQKLADKAAKKNKNKKQPEQPAAAPASTTPPATSTPQS